MISETWMEVYPPLEALSLCTSPSQSATNQWRWGFLHREGWYRPKATPFLSPGCQNCRCLERFLIQGWDSTFTGWRWLCVRAPANWRSAHGVGVSTQYRAVSTRGAVFVVPGSRRAISTALHAGYRLAQTALLGDLYCTAYYVNLRWDVRGEHGRKITYDCKVSREKLHGLLLAA